MTLEEAHTASAAFIRALDPNAQRLWESGGPKNTAIHDFQAWTVHAEGDRCRVVIVQHFGNKRAGPRAGQSDGWMIFPEVGLIQIDQTREAYLKLPLTEKAAVPA